MTKMAVTTSTIGCSYLKSLIYFVFKYKQCVLTYLNVRFTYTLLHSLREKLSQDVTVLICHAAHC